MLIYLKAGRNEPCPCGTSPKMLDAAIHFAGRHFRTKMEKAFKGFVAPGHPGDLDEIVMTNFDNYFLPGKLTATEEIWVYVAKVRRHSFQSTYHIWRNHVRDSICIFLLTVLLIIGAPSAFGEEQSDISILKEELGAYKEELGHIRKELREYRESLDLLQKLCGMDRYRLPETVRLFGKPVPLERRDIRERMEREFLLSVHETPQVLLWMKRAYRYFPFIEEQLGARRMPEDLKYVAIVESALLPTIHSHAGAAGLWQFMPSTGSKYGLKRNSYVDERRDPVQATKAALDYLGELYEMFGDWLLALAAYNAGEKRIEKELNKQNVSSYYDLILPSETERYLFRIAAAKIVLSTPEAYGYQLEPDEVYKPFDCDVLRVQVKCPRVDLVSLAQACEMTLRSFKKFNPHFRKTYVSSGQYTIYVPMDKSEEALEFITNCIASGEKIVHRVRRGETLWDIGKEYHVPVKAIQQWNGLENSSRIYPGQLLVIHNELD